jgi:hypothetical protein
MAWRGKEYCRAVLGEDVALENYGRWVSGLREIGATRKKHHGGRHLRRVG